jgi:23S rRNA (cytidine2498-2'-O)-methyltransferase
VFFTCQAGFQDLLADELAARSFAVGERGGDWVVATPADAAGETAGALDLAFPHGWMPSPREFAGESVNALAQGLADAFLEQLRGERVEGPWPCLFSFPAEVVGLGRRVSAVEKAFEERVRARLSRVARLAQPDLPRSVGQQRGWRVHFVDFRRAFGSREFWTNGAHRMADDERAPSRSYLKVEEAYLLAGREPVVGETVVDLGAAPGGWSYSAAKRGARVLALDNGPLKGGALDHPQIEHRREDAFGFRPAEGEVFDWLFCDLVEDPHHVLENLVGPWLVNRWCRRFVVNLKFGRVDPVAFLQELRSPEGLLAKRAPGARIRHLFHDREEFTVVGEVAP